MLYLDEKPSFILQEKLILTEDKIDNIKQQLATNLKNTRNLVSKMQIAAEQKDIKVDTAKLSDIAKQVTETSMALDKLPKTEDKTTRYKQLLRSVQAWLTEFDNKWHSNYPTLQSVLSTLENQLDKNELINLSKLIETIQDIEDNNDVSKKLERITNLCDEMLSSIKAAKNIQLASAQQFANQLKSITNRLEKLVVEDNAQKKTRPVTDWELSSINKYLDDLLKLVQNQTVVELTDNPDTEYQIEDSFNKTDQFLADYKKLQDSKASMSDYDRLWERYYPSWEKTWGFDANEFGLLSRLGQAFKEEILAYGTFESTNPFIKYLLQLKKIFNLYNIDLNLLNPGAYAVIHNEVADNKFDKADLLGKGKLGIANLIFSPALLQLDGVLARQYLKLQAELLRVTKLNKIELKDRNGQPITVDLQANYLTDITDRRPLVQMIFNAGKDDLHVKLTGVKTKPIINPDEYNFAIKNLRTIEATKRIFEETTGVTSDTVKKELPTNIADIAELPWFKQITPANYRQFLLYIIITFCKKTETKRKYINNYDLTKISLTADNTLAIGESGLDDYNFNSDQTVSQVLDQINNTFSQK